MNPYVAVLLDHTFQLIGLVLSISAPLVVTWFLQKKLKLQETEALQEQLESVLMKAIYLAEEVGRGTVKTAEKTEGSKKLETALTFAKSELKRLGVKELGETHLKDLIHAKLRLERPSLNDTV